MDERILLALSQILSELQQIRQLIENPLVTTSNVYQPRYISKEELDRIMKEFPNRDGGSDSPKE